MAISTFEQVSISKYIAKAKMDTEKKRIPLVLMLEPQFKTNLVTNVCGKSDYPQKVLDEYLSVEKCIYSVRECEAPIVAICGGEPLLNEDTPELVEALHKEKKFIYLTTNALLLPKNIYDYSPSKYFRWSINLNGMKEEHDQIAGQEGVFDNAIHSIKLAKTKGFRVTINCTIYSHQRIKKIIDFLTFASDELGVDGINISPSFSYERASDKKSFYNRENIIKIFRTVFKSKKFKKWKFNQNIIYLDFLAGNRSFTCTPWATPTRNIFGWQKPCYHLAEGYFKSYNDLIEKTDWKQYGTGNYEKCRDCMTHCGYEPSALNYTFQNPIESLTNKLFGIKTSGPVVEEISQQTARPAEDLYERILESKMYELDLM